MSAIVKILSRLKTIFFDLQRSVILNCILVGCITYFVKIFFQYYSTDIAYQYTIRVLSVLTTFVGIILILRSKVINIINVCLYMIIIGLVLTYG